MMRICMQGAGRIDDTSVTTLPDGVPKSQVGRATESALETTRCAVDDPPLISSVKYLVYASRISAHGLLCLFFLRLPIQSQPKHMLGWRLWDEALAHRVSSRGSDG